jgi:preprotein translocase subunit SecG
MTYIESAVLVLHVLTAIAVCGFVLLQHGKGADMGAAFGSGSSGSLFGAAGSANFLSRTTAILATLFFVTSVGLTYFGTLHGKPQGLMERGGLMDKAVPVAPKASDVPQPAGALPGATPAAGTGPGGGPAPATGTTPEAPKGEVPK